MPFFSCQNVQITGIACAVPENVVEVDSFKGQFGAETVEKFKAMAGVQRFRKTADKQTASDLGFAAADYLLEQKNIARDSIHALVFVTHSPDYRRPATAGVLQQRLGLPQECAAFDLNLGCSAYPYGLFTLAAMMECSDIDRALLVCAESVTKVANPQDRVTAMIFGDCGSATILEKGNGEGIRGAVRTDGNKYRAIIVPGGGFRYLDAPKEVTVWPDGNYRSLHNLVMDGEAVFHFTITEVPELIQEFLAFIGLQVDHFDAFAMHQANLFILKQIARKLKIPSLKMPISIDEYGNTSGPSIPLTLCKAYAGQANQKILRTLMCGFGVGLSWGVASASIEAANLLPIITSDTVFNEGRITSPDDLGAQG